MGQGRSDKKGNDRALHAARKVVRRLRKAGWTALFAGGCVRDRLLGKEPEDYDVATDAPPEQVMRLFSETMPVGAQFGVVLVIVDRLPIQVATFRSDLTYEDGRHPVGVRRADPREDAARRDFTINGMFLDPETEEIIDFVGGRDDLRRRLIRAIGDPEARFAEDHLRMLRAVRFAARLGFEIEDKTFAAIRRLAPQITTIARERIGDEIVRILTEGNARRGFELLDACGLLPQVLPEVAAMKGVEQPPQFHPEGDVWQHTLLALEHMRNPTETLALGVLLHDVGKPVTAGRGDDGRITFHDHARKGAEIAARVVRRLRRSRSVVERVAWLVRNHLRVRDAPRMRRSTLRRFLAQAGIEELLELARADALAGNGDLRAWEFCRQVIDSFGAENLRPEPLLRGRDLVALGYPPGPLFARILKLVEEEQLEGRLGTREEAIRWVQERFPLATVARDHG